MPIKNCLQCKNKFMAKKSINIFCSQFCYGNNKSNKLKGIKPKYMDGFKKGLVSWNKGRKSPNNQVCGDCSTNFYNSHKRRFCSRKCQLNNMSKTPNKRKLSNNIRRLKKYNEWKEIIIKREGGICQKCGSNKQIEVDHFPRSLSALIAMTNVKKAHEAIEHPEFWDVTQGRLLCHNCHIKTITSKNTHVKINNTSVCVTGGAGMIGSHLIDELLARGNEVLVIDNLLAGEKSFINPKAKFVYFDITDNPSRFAKILKENNIKYVFHLASLPYIPKCFDDPHPFFSVNAGGTMNTLIACEMANVKKVLVYSSAEIYGTKKEPIKETDELKPQSTYGVAKIAADQLSKIRYIEANCPAVINRQFNVFSWRARHPYIIPELISQLVKGPEVELGNIYAYRDFLFVEDAVKMAIELLEKGIPGEEYNIGAEETIQIKELAERVGKVLGYDKIKIKVDKSRLRPWDIARLQSDNTKLYNTISYRPETSLEDGIKKVIKKFKENNNKWDF